jgi:predicted hotdog family 3-hydroxylacyl-ACP dehydratase
MSAFPPIAALVPHAPPMLLLDAVTLHEPGRVRCAARVRPDWPFVEDGRVEAVVALEVMAQAVAAFAGLSGRAEGQAPRLGMLLGTRALELAVPHLSVGDALTVEAQHVFSDEALGTFRCTVERAGPAGPERVAEATLNVYQHDGVSPFPT